MHRFSRLLAILLVLSMALGMLVPAAIAQDDEAFLETLDQFMTNLPRGYWAVVAPDLNTELVDNPPYLVDIRQPEEYEAGHIQDAINIPLRELGQNLNKLPDLDANIVVYCKAGHRGALALTGLQLLGYTNTRNLYGGILAWEAEEFPTVTEPTEAEAGEAPNIDPALLERVDEMWSSIPEGWGVIRPDGLNVRLSEAEPPFLLDVRTRREVAAGYIEGTEVAEVHDLVSMSYILPEDKTAPVVVYCGSGWRSAIAEVALWLMGYENVFSLAGGVRAWIAAEYPLTQSMHRVADYYLRDLLPEGWGNVKAEDVLAMEEMPFLLDVREPGELEENGYIPGAVNIPVRQVGDNLDKLPALDAPIVVYCAKGTRGAFVMTALQMLGYEDVRNMAGGFAAWIAAGGVEAVDPIAEAEAGDMPEVDDFVLEAVNNALTTWPEGWGMVGAEALSEMLADEEAMPAAIIDVRQPEEWVADGIIEGAELVALRDLGSYLPVLEDTLPDKTAKIVVYCKAGHRGAIAMTVLRAAGYENVLNLAGGFSAWSAAGYPVAEMAE